MSEGKLLTEEALTREQIEAVLSKHLAHYEAYHRILYTEPHSDIRMADFNWRRADGNDATRLSRATFFNSMSDEFSEEIANHVNDLVVVTERLQAWSQHLDGISDKVELLDVLHEFVSPLAHHALGLPYALKQKFYFSYAHLANQARRLFDANDDLEADNRIDRDVARRYKGDWCRDDDFFEAVGALAAPDMAAETSNFRNAFHHQITPGIGLGITNRVKRYVSTGGKPSLDDAALQAMGIELPTPGDRKVVYAMGGQPPLRMSEVVLALRKQIALAHECFDLFKEYIWFIEDRIIASFGEADPLPR